MLAHTSRPLLVRYDAKLQIITRSFVTDSLPKDDIRDIYRRAEGQELVVEGLREGQTLVGEE